MTSTKELTREKPTEPAPRTASAAYRPFDFIQSEIDRVFETFNGAAWPVPFAARAFSPSMEIIETDDAIEVTTELPGIDEKDVEISVADGLLTIRGEKKFEKDEKSKRRRLIERSYGAFERVVGLPAGVDASKIKASMSKGVLRIEAPKPATAKSQAVRINAQ